MVLYILILRDGETWELSEGIFIFTEDVFRCKYINHVVLTLFNAHGINRSKIQVLKMCQYDHLKPRHFMVKCTALFLNWHCTHMGEMCLTI
jgi:hypothetical protein